MRIILDTNVYISSFIFGGNARLAFDVSFLEHEVYVSDFILQEISRVLKGKFGLEQIRLNKLINALSIQAVNIKPVGTIPTVCRDVDDNNILWLAETCNSDYIVTGDKDLLTLISFKGTQIVHPVDFIKSIK